MNNILNEIARAGVTCALALGMVRVAQGADAVRLATRGDAAASEIVLPAQASESQKYAAEELRDYVKRMTGVTLPVRSDAEDLPSRAVLIGETRHTAKALGVAADVKGLGDDGFRLVAKGPHLLVLGSRVRGCLYGVYELLEKYGGCRWYASWHTVVPELASFKVPGDLDDVQRPDFAMRTSWWWDVNAHQEFAARLRVNSRPWGAMGEKFGGDSFRFCRRLQSCHTFDFLLPPSKYRKDHPEYYSSTGGMQTQPCLTNPDVLAIVTSNVLEQIRLDPDAMAYGVSQNDWYNYCTCPRCKAVDDEEGSHAGTMVRFVNAVAEAVEKKYPGKIIETLAYQYTRRPPTKTKLRHNVVPCLCTIECDFGRPIPESQYHQNKSFMNDIVGWSRMTDQLYIWDYVTNFRHYPYPLPNCYAMQGNLKFFRDHKAREMFPEGDYQGRLADFDVLKAWLLAKWQWNADLPMKDLLDDFFAGYYGKAAPFVRTYFEELHRVHRAKPAEPRLIYEPVTCKALPDDFLARAAKLFEQALAAVKDEPKHAYNVRGTAFSVDYTRFMRLEPKCGSLLWFGKGERQTSLLNEASALARRMLSVMDEYKPVRLAESAVANDSEFELIRKAAARQPGSAKPQPAVTRGCIEEKDLAYCHPATMGTLVDDPKADDGRALKLFNNHFEWSTQMSFSRIVTDPGQKLHLRVRCRIEKKPEPRKGEAFWTGVYDYELKRGACEIEVAVETIPDENYAWYDVGTFVPRDPQVFWIGPGRFGKDGKSNIGALYVDKIELSVVEPSPSAKGTAPKAKAGGVAGGFAFDATKCRIPDRFRNHPLYTAPIVGVNFGFGGKRGYYAANLDVPAKMKQAGVNWCVLKIHPCMETFCSRKVFFDPVFTVGEQETADLIREFHKNGIHVMLQPSLAMLDSTTMYWSCPFPEEDNCQIEGRQPQYWKPWFESYREALNVLAAFAERNGVEAFIAGCELYQTIKRTEEWRETVRQLRQHYSGPISYENGGTCTYAWLKDLDFVCLSYYPEAAPMPAERFVSADQWNALPDVSREQMVAYLREHAVAPLDALHAAADRLPVILTEAGMTGAHGWCREPWNGMCPYQKGVRIDHAEQANYIDAVFEVFTERPYCPGICLWKWDESQPRWFRNLEDPSKDGGFNFPGKKAEKVFRAWAEKAKRGR